MSSSKSRKKLKSISIIIWKKATILISIIQPQINTIINLRKQCRMFWSNDHELRCVSSRPRRQKNLLCERVTISLWFQIYEKYSVFNKQTNCSFVLANILIVIVISTNLKMKIKCTNFLIYCSSMKIFYGLKLRIVHYFLFHFTHNSRIHKLKQNHSHIINHKPYAVYPFSLLLEYFMFNAI